MNPAPGRSFLAAVLGRAPGALTLAVLAGAVAPPGVAAARGAPAAPARPSGAAASGPWAGTGMWIWYVSASQGGRVAAIASRARAHRVSTVFVKSSDGTRTWAQFSPATVAALKAAGLHVCAWQFVYGADPVGEARAGAAAVRSGAECLVIDAEGAYEGRYAQAQRYLRAFRARVGTSYPLGLTSFPYVDYHPGLPYSVFLGPGGASFNLPQVYWKAIGTTVPHALARTYTYNQVYGRTILPLGQLYDHPSISDVTRFRQLAASYRSPSVSWLDWQETSPPGWAALGGLFAALPRRTATPWPVLSTARGGKVGSRGDIVVWAQEHLAAAGRAVTIDGRFGATTGRAVAEFQAGAGLPATGVIDGRTWPRLLRYAVTTPKWSSPARATTARRRAITPASASLPARRYETPRGPLRPPAG